MMGIPAAFASWMTGTIDFESQGLRTMAATFLTMKSLIWLLCLATSLSPLTTRDWYACFAPSLEISSPMTLKNGLSRVRRETPMVPCDAAGWEGDAGGGVRLLQAPSSRAARRGRIRFMGRG